MTNEEQFHYDRLQDGLEYQDLINEYMIKNHNMPIIYYTSYKKQWTGESHNGIEIKYDEVSSRTTNLFILTRIKNKQGKWQSSGLYKKDNTTWFIIGNKTEAWMLSKHMLLQVVKGCMLVENKLGTTEGYLLPKKIADKIRCIKIIL